MAITFKVSMAADVPVNAVWESFMNQENLKHWLSGFVSIEHLMGTPGHKGSVNKLKFLERGREIEVIEVVREVVPYNLYSFENKSKSFSILIDVKFVSIGQTTEIIQIAQISPSGFLMKIWLSFLKQSMKTHMDKDLKKFRQFIENHHQKT